MRPVLAVVGLFLVAGVSVCLAQLPDVPKEAVDVLGTTPGTPLNRGFVFIEGRYIVPPYTVIRKGNGIFINHIQVEQPFAWSAEVLTPEITPATKKGEEEPKANSVEQENGLEEVRGLEGAGSPLNATDAVTEKPADVQRGNTLDALFNEGAVKAPAEEDQDASSEQTAPTVLLTKKQKDELRQNLDMRRLRFETALSQGEFFLFNHKYGRINGTYGTAKTLFAVLPEAVRYAQSPQDLMMRLNQGGINFLDVNACADLYRNKLNFVSLNERRRAIEISDEKKTGSRLR